MDSVQRSVYVWKLSLSLQDYGSRYTACGNSRGSGVNDRPATSNPTASVSARLLNEIEKIEARLPEEMKVERQTRNFLMPNKVTVVEEFPVMVDLHDWANELQQTVETLERGK